MAREIDAEHGGESAPAMVRRVTFSAFEVDARAAITVAVSQATDALEVVDLATLGGLSSAAIVIVRVALATGAPDALVAVAAVDLLAIAVVHTLAASPADADPTPVPTPLVATVEIVAGDGVDAVHFAVAVDTVRTAIGAPTPFVGSFDAVLGAVLADAVGFDPVGIAPGVVPPVAAGAIVSVG